MKGILADVNADGHVEVLLRALLGDIWIEAWNELNVPVVTFADLGLSLDVDDQTLWETCQREQVVLVTINRNAEGPLSLEAVIQTKNASGSLPVFTLANPDRLLRDRDYAIHTAVRLLEYLLEIDQYRGTGRIYVP